MWDICKCKQWVWTWPALHNSFCQQTLHQKEVLKNNAISIGYSSMGYSLDSVIKYSILMLRNRAVKVFGSSSQSVFCAVWGKVLSDLSTYFQWLVLSDRRALSHWRPVKSIRLIFGGLYQKTLWSSVCSLIMIFWQ